MSVGWRGHTESDEKSILAAKSGDKSIVVVVRRLGDFNAVWELAGAFRTGDCGDLKTTSFDERLGDETATIAAGLAYGQLVQTSVVKRYLRRQWRFS